MSRADVLQALARAHEALDAVGARHALVGGLAVSVRGEVRFTRDVDFAVAVEDDRQAEAIVRALRSHGMSLRASVEQEATGRLATARMVSSEGSVVDLIFGTTGIEPAIVAEATEESITDALAIPVARREHLVAMKVLSASMRRPNDLLDLRGLLALDLDFDVIHDALDRITEAGANRGVDLRARLAELRRSLFDEG